MNADKNAISYHDFIRIHRWSKSEDWIQPDFPRERQVPARPMTTVRGRALYPQSASFAPSATLVCATMKLTITTVKVCSTELNDSRSKESVTDECREAPPESTTEVRISQPQ